MPTENIDVTNRVSIAAEIHRELCNMERIFVDPASIKISETYQRQVKPKLVRAIREDFCAAAYGTPVLGRRANGYVWTVDGQQRITAALELGLTTIPAVVFASHGPEHEASVFLYMNRNRLRVNAAEIFKAAWKEGDYAMRDILTTLQKHGFNFGVFAKTNKKDYPNIQAVNVIQNIYALDGGRNHLDNFLAFLRATWPNNKAALEGNVMHGLSYFLFKFGHLIDREAFIKFLSKHPPTRIVSDAKLRGGGGRYIDIAKACFKLYNTSRIRPKLTNADFDDVFIKTDRVLSN